MRLPSINLKVLHNALPLTAAERPYTKIVVTSKSTNCSEKFTYPAPAVNTTGYLPNSALPFGNYTCAWSPACPAAAAR